MSVPSRRPPAIAGVGQVVQRVEDPREAASPLALMEQARAAYDESVSALDAQYREAIQRPMSESEYRVLTAEYEAAKKDPAFREELDYFLTHYVGRPSPLYYAERLTEQTQAG